MVKASSHSSNLFIQFVFFVVVVVFAFCFLDAFNLAINLQCMVRNRFLLYNCVCSWQLELGKASVCHSRNVERQMWQLDEA